MSENKVVMEVHSLYRENPAGDVCGTTFEGVVMVKGEDRVLRSYPFSFQGKVGTPKQSRGWFCKGHEKVKGRYQRVLREADNE